MRVWNFQHLVKCDAKEHETTGDREGDMQMFTLFNRNNAPVSVEEYKQEYQKWVPLNENIISEKRYAG